MRYLGLRQIWCDAFMPQGFSGSQAFLDPKTPRRNPYTQRAAREIHAKESRSTRGNDERIWDSMEMGKAQTIIAKMPSLNRSLGMYLYTEMFTQQDLDRVRQWLYYTWMKKLGDEEDLDNYKKIARIVICVAVVIEGVKHTHATGQPMTHTELAGKIEVNKQHLKRDGWLCRINQMTGMLDKIDRDALQPLSILLNKGD